MKPTPRRSAREDLLFKLEEAASGSAPASESAVSREVEKWLRESMFAVRLDEFKRGTRLAAGTLVYLKTEHRGKPRKASGAISRGAADFWLARVRTWGWIGIELKERRSEGRQGGRLSDEQETALESGLYSVAWDVSHVRAIVSRLDNLTRKASHGSETKGGSRRKAQSGPGAQGDGKAGS